MHVSKIGFRRERNRAQFQTGPGQIIDTKTGEISPLPSRTKQEFRDECDINNILAQYRQTGMIRHISARAAQGAYMDLPDPVDFQMSTNIILEATSAFMTLPSKVRERFFNDPERFLQFMADPANQDEAIKLGLATRVPDPESNGPPDRPPPPPPAAAGAAQEPPNKGAGPQTS